MYWERKLRRQTETANTRRQKPVQIGDQKFESMEQAAGHFGIESASLRYHIKKYGQFRGMEVKLLQRGE